MRAWSAAAAGRANAHAGRRLHARDRRSTRRRATAGCAEARGARASCAPTRRSCRRCSDDKTRLQAGFLAMDPRNGEVRAWVGSRDFAQDQFDHVQQARRQPGSTFKPFVYGAAFEQGARPGRHLHRPAGGDPRSATARSGARPTSAPPSGQPMTLRDGLVVFEEHHHRAGDAAGRRRRAWPSWRARMGVRESKLDAGAVAGAGHQPGDAARDGGGLRHHRQRRPLRRAGAGDAHRGPQRQGAGGVPPGRAGAGAAARAPR